MNAETKIKSALHSAMAAAFPEIEGATKDSTNPHFKSQYADLASVVAAIKPALIKQGLFFTQCTEPSEGGVIVETMVHHSSGESMSFGKLFVPANRNDAQGFGSALTYARRYSLMTGFGVAPEDDDGNAASKSAPAKKADVPFPQGPARNKMDLKEKGRAFWKDVEACGDEDELTSLIATHVPLVSQIKEVLPEWWHGGTKDGGEPFEGLGDVIDKRLTDFRNLANVRTPIDAG